MNCKNKIIISSVISIIIIIIWFHRQPPIDFDNISKVNGIVCPSYGTVMSIKETPHGTYHVAIFLSPIDIHVQYVPINGVVVESIYDPSGNFNLAYDLNKSSDNEKHITIIKDSNDRHVKVTQIAGMFVRRVVNNMCVGDEVTAGHKLGMIRLGSRVDIEVNKIHAILDVKVGQKVNGPYTILGRWR